MQGDRDDAQEISAIEMIYFMLNEENIKRINNANKTLVQTNKQLYFK